MSAGGCSRSVVVVGVLDSEDESRESEELYSVKLWKLSQGQENIMWRKSKRCLKRRDGRSLFIVAKLVFVGCLRVVGSLLHVTCMYKGVEG